MRLKKIVFIVAGTLMMLFSVLPAVGIAEAAVTVRMDGTAVDGNFQAAIERAKKRAVFKVLSHATRPENASDSIFAKLISDYKSYVEGYRIEKQSSKGDKIQVILNVLVDNERLWRAFQGQVADKQASEKNEDMTACLIVRARGTDAPEENESLIHMAFQNSFTQQGFQMEGSEFVRNNLYKVRDVSFDEFQQRIVSAVKEGRTDALMTCVIYGEFQQEAVYPSPGGDGYVAKGSLRLVQWDVIADRFSDSFYREYTMLGTTQSEACKLLIHKAAADGAEHQARTMLSFWRNK